MESLKAGRIAAVILAAIAALACGGSKHPLTKEQAVEMIQSSEAFLAPIDPGIIFVESTFRPGPNTKRELLRLEGLSAKQYGPFGMAGTSAIGAFTWRWTEGPFAGQVFRSKVKFNDSGDGWKIYNDLLKKELYKAERGEEE